jgi:hypothetical protein
MSRLRLSQKVAFGQVKRTTKPKATKSEGRLSDVVATKVYALNFDNNILKRQLPIRT